MCEEKSSLALISLIVTEQKKPNVSKLSDEITEDEMLDMKIFGHPLHAP